MSTVVDGFIMGGVMRGDCGMPKSGCVRVGGLRFRLQDVAISGVCHLQVALVLYTQRAVVRCV